MWSVSAEEYTAVWCDGGMEEESTPSVRTSSERSAGISCRIIGRMCAGRRLCGGLYFAVNGCPTMAEACRASCTPV
ncbi:MAG: hypothetical protein OXF02_04925 [Simkaniaceae bacterium]|nr:hypothetical protein [Simkaniaceae bacterium]